MNRSLRPLLIPLTLLVSSTAALAEPLTATYIGTPNGRHGYAAVQRFTLTVDPLMVPFSAEPDWWEIAFILEDATLAVRARSAAVPMLAPGGPSPEIERYQFRGRDGGAFEYVHALTGEALLPSFDFQLSFLPRAATRSSVDEYGFARSGTLLGHAYLLEKVEMAAAPLEPWEDAVRLELNPDLLVGTARSFRDVTLGRIPGPEDYEYVAFVESEYDEMVAAGINFAVVSPAQKPWVQKRSIFYCSWHPEFPDDFYRSNYFGWAYCMDEPAVLLYEDRTVGDHIRDVRDVATAMRARAKAEYHLVSGAGDLIRFGQGGAIGGVNADPLRLVQSSVPYWDTIVSAAYYELAEGGGGVLHEGRYDLPAEQALWDAVFGPGIALATDEALLINYAFLRGAARNFNKYWGTSIYGQADPALSPRALELAYDMGARLLWFWTSDHDHHLPWPEQLALARHLRDHAAAHPRAPHDVLIEAATTLIALPDGYVLDPYVLWKYPALSVDMPNHTGTTHRAVLRRFLAEAYGCLTRGETFDFAVDTYDLRPEGYARVVRVQFDASVIESGPAARRGVEDAVAVLRLEAEPEAAVEIDTATRPVVTAFWAGASPPVIDGDLSDWVDAAWVKLEPNPHGLDHLDGPEDLDGECAFAVDADHLYLALRVTDDVHAQPFGGWLLWSGDCVQVAVDPLLDSTDAGYGPDDSEFGFTLHHDGRVETWWWYTPKESGGREDIEVAIVREGNQTLYEAAIPAAAIAPWSPLLTRRSGICVAVADADQAALDSAGGDAASRVGRESAIELTDSVVYSKRPDRFAVLELEGPGPDVAAPPVVALGRRRVAAPAGEPLVFTLFGWIPEAQTVRVECELTGDTQSELPASIDVALDAGSNRLRLDVSTAALPRGLHRLTLRALLGGEVADTQQTDVFVW